MTDYHHLVHLDNLLIKELDRLKVGLLTDFFDSIKEVSVVGLGKVSTGEKIGNDAIEQRDVVRQELRKIDIYDGTQQL